MIELVCNWFLGKIHWGIGGENIRLHKALSKDPSTPGFLSNTNSSFTDDGNTFPGLIRGRWWRISANNNLIGSIVNDPDFPAVKISVAGRHIPSTTTRIPGLAMTAGDFLRQPGVGIHTQGMEVSQIGIYPQSWKDKPWYDQGLQSHKYVIVHTQNTRETTVGECKEEYDARKFWQTKGDRWKRSWMNSRSRQPF